MSPDLEEQQRVITETLGALGSQDPHTRATAAAAADDFLQNLGLTWSDIADAIEHMSSVENWSGGWSDRAPRADTEWIRFVDRDNRAGYGRWHHGQALTVRSHHRGAGSYFAAVNGNALYRHGKAMLFRDIGKAQAAVEKHAVEAFEVESCRRSK